MEENIHNVRSDYNDISKGDLPSCTCIVVRGRFPSFGSETRSLPDIAPEMTDKARCFPEEKVKKQREKKTE